MKVKYLGPDDVVVIADSGGVVPSLRKPVSGAEKVAALLAHASKTPGFVATAAWINAMPGARFDYEDATAAVSVVVEGGRITRIFAITNPHKLGSLEKVVELQR